MRLLTLPISAAFFGLTVIVSACGGGGGGDSTTGVRLTDPAAVPSSTRIANAVLYQIQGNQIIATGATAAAELPTSVPQRAGGNATHVVAPGDNCASIADQYGVSLEELLKANRFINTDCSNLRVDESLRIPSAAGAATTAAGTPVPGRPNGNSYTVQPGDTCDGIATSNGTTVDALISANPSIDSDCTNLRIDQVLRIP